MRRFSRWRVRLASLLRSRRAAIRNWITAPDGQRALEHLSKFCHVHKTTHVVGDTHGSAQLEGRRQVWLLITQTARLTDREVEDLVERLERETIHAG